MDDKVRVGPCGTNALIWTSVRIVPEISVRPIVHYPLDYPHTPNSSRFISSSRVKWHPCSAQGSEIPDTRIKGSLETYLRGPYAIHCVRDSSRDRDASRGRSVMP